jgi:hypothetical protein
MTARVHPKLADEPSTNPCSRCLSFVTATAGDWHGDLLICPRRGCGQPEAVTSRSRPLHGDVASGAQR